MEPLVSYADESEGTGEGSILLLSACIHNVRAWTDFSNEWRKALDEKPSIPNFHMREARKLAGPFAKWKAVDRDLKIVSLVDVIMRFKPHIVNCWLSVHDYNKIMRGTAPYDLRHAYFKCFAAIVIKVADYLRIIGSTIPADYVFDDKGDIGNEALMWYPAIKESAPREIKPLMGSTPIFRNDEEVLPLQAADLIARHKRRRKEVPALDAEVAPTLRIDDLPGGELHLTTEYLQESAKKMAALPNVWRFTNGPSVYQLRKRAIKKGRKSF